jgi:hypothetical protein
MTGKFLLGKKDLADALRRPSAWVLICVNLGLIAGGEYRRTHPTLLMTRPYGRIVALHITIILGAFLTMTFDSPLGLLVTLMVLKTSFDLAMHESERNKFQGIY